MRDADEIWDRMCRFKGWDGRADRSVELELLFWKLDGRCGRESEPESGFRFLLPFFDVKV